jgi:glutathione S-transferase
MMYVVEAMAGGRLPNAPAEITEFVKKIHERPAWKAGLEKGGPYGVAGKL